MRLPPLPVPAPPLTPEQMARRVVGDRPAEVTRPIQVSPYDPGWPERYRAAEARIRAALGDRALAVEHVGSTAVPGLAAKDRVDVDLIVADPAAEGDYVPALETAGFALRTREPHWYEHRCLWTANHDVSVHVFGPDCDEHLRHLSSATGCVPILTTATATRRASTGWPSSIRCRWPTTWPARRISSWTFCTRRASASPALCESLSHYS